MIARTPSCISTESIHAEETSIITNTEEAKGNGARIETLASESTPQRATMSPVIRLRCHAIG